MQSSPVQSLAGSFENRADRGTGRWVQRHGDWLLGSSKGGSSFCTLGTSQGASMEDQASLEASQV